MHPTTPDTEQDRATPEPTAALPNRPTARPWSSPTALRPQSPVATYIGVVVVALGFVLLALSWAGVAGKREVSEQMPYIASAGFLGLGVVMVGLTTVSVAAKRRDSALRDHQITLLAAALRDLQQVESNEP